MQSDRPAPVPAAWSPVQRTQDAPLRVAGAIPDSLLICGALSVGAMFGSAAQTVLRHTAVDPAVAWRDFFVLGMPRTESAFAWWTWWLVVVAVFVAAYAIVARLSGFADPRRRYRSLRWLAAAALVLTLSMMGRINAAPMELDAMGSLMVSLAVVVLPAIAAALGAYWARRHSRATAAQQR